MHDASTNVAQLNLHSAHFVLKSARTMRRRVAHSAFALVFALFALCLAHVVAAEAPREVPCEYAARVCGTTIRNSVAADAKLSRALEDMRRGARENAVGHGARVLAGYFQVRALVPDMAFAELLALGCCLYSEDGACARDVVERESAVMGNASAAAAAKSLGAEFLFAAGSHAKVSVMPEAVMLAGEARACAPPAGATRCDDTLIEMYKKAGADGVELGIVRAGDALLMRYGAGLATRVQGEEAVEDCAVVTGGDTMDAVAARKLFNSLLASNAFDKLAAARLKELGRAEQLWLDPKYGGKPDRSYILADFLVQMISRMIVGGGVVLVLYIFRRTRCIQWTFRTLIKLTMIEFFFGVMRKVSGFIAFLRGPSAKSVAECRQARRLEAQKAAKEKAKHRKQT